jgi:hypothetical protein
MSIPDPKRRVQQDDPPTKREYLIDGEPPDGDDDFRPRLSTEAHAEITRRGWTLAQYREHHRTLISESIRARPEPERTPAKDQPEGRGGKRAEPGPKPDRHEDAAPAGPAVEPFRPFPLELLPEPVRGFIRAGAAAIGCDPAFVALPTLTALASAIGNTRRIQLKKDWQEPAILWTVVLAESGAKKSPPFDLAMRPLYRRQHLAMKRYSEAMREYKQAAKKYKRDLAKWERSKSEGDPPIEPDPPVCERCWVDDVTTEGLLPLLAQQWRGLLLKKDELSAWFGSFDRYQKGGKNGADAARFVEMFGGRPVCIDRKTSGTLYVPRAALCVTGGIQPAIFRLAMTWELKANGLLARLLAAMPPAKARKWSEASIDEKLLDALDRVYDRLFGLAPGVNRDGDPTPVDLPMTREGKEVWISFYNEHAEELADLTGDLSAAWSKLEGYAARLSLVVQLVRWAADDKTANPAEVDAASIRAGIGLSRWFGNETKRIYAISEESTEAQERRELVEFISRKGGTITNRQLQGINARRYPTAAAAEQALDALAKAGLGKWQTDTHDGGPGRPVVRFVLRTYGASDTNTNGVEPGENADCVGPNVRPEAENGHCVGRSGRPDGNGLDKAPSDTIRAKPDENSNSVCVGRQEQNQTGNPPAPRRRGSL